MHHAVREANQPAQNGVLRLSEILIVAKSIKLPNKIVIYVYGFIHQGSPEKQNQWDVCADIYGYMWKEGVWGV